MISSLLLAQKTTIQGKITTTDGQPAPFVSVMIRQLKKTVMTNEDGFYVIENVPAGSYTLSVSHTGLATQEKNITVTKEHTVEISLSISETAKQLDNVVVNTHKGLNDRPVDIGKIAINPKDLPQSVTIIGQGAIRDQQMQRLSDVVKNTNGLYVSSTRGSTQETFAARGYTFGSGNLFKNGSRVNTGVIPEVSSLERVEVLKGSTAILFGNVSAGGILNMVTKQPKFNFGGEVSFRAGSYDLYKPSFDVYGPISKNIAYRLLGTYETANSYRDNVQSKRYYVNPSFLFKLGKKTELLVQGDYLKHDFTPDFGIGSIDANQIPDVARSAFFGTAWQYAHTQQYTGTVALKHQFSDAWNIRTSISYQRYERDYFSTERIQFSGAAANRGDWARPVNRTWNSEDYFIGQIDVTGKFKTGSIEHTLLAGVDADRYYQQARGYQIKGGTTYDTLNIFNPGKYRQRTDIPDVTAITFTKTPTNRAGAYVQDLVSLTAKLKLLAGIRWSIQEALPVQMDSLLKNVSRTTSGHVTNRAFSPRAGLVYQFNNIVSAFASYSNSFVVNSGTDIYYRQLDPSIINQYEIGIKNDFFNKKLSFNVTAYRIVNSNLAQTALFDSAGKENANTNLKELTGQTTSDGVEVDIAGHPLAGLDVLAGYSYNNMRYTKTSDKSGSYFIGDRLVGTPQHTANGTVFYTLQNGPVKGLKIGVSVFYIGDRVGGWNDTKTVANGVVTRAAKTRMIPVKGYTTLDLTAGYSFKAVSLLAKVSNLTNTLSYNVHENYSINPIAPRQFLATVAYRF